MKLSKDEFLQMMVDCAETLAATTVKADGEKIVIYEKNGDCLLWIDMNPFYQGYCMDSFRLSDIIRVVSKIAKGAKFENPDVDKIVTRFNQEKEPAELKEIPESEQVKGKLTISDLQQTATLRLVNINHPYYQGRKAIADVIGDMCMVVGLSIDGKYDIIDKSLLSDCNISHNEIMAIAAKNTVKMSEIFLTNEGGFYKITNKDEHYGATMMMIPGCLSAVAKKLNEKELYIVPIHKDFIYCFTVDNDVREIRQVFDECLRHIRPEEKLSETVFLYNAERDGLKRIS